MATGAEDGGIGKLRHDGAGIIGMFRERAVAAFAAEFGVGAVALDLGLIGVAGFASFPAGELDGPGADVIDGAGPIVAEFTELGGDDGAADEEECD